MSKRLVVFGYGNPARGDDALGPLLLARLEAAPPPPGLTLTLVEDFQLQIEHALDLDGADLALFLDAGTGTPAPFLFSEIAASGQLGHSHTSHALSPQAVLDVFITIRHRPPPPAFLLCPRGARFELGEPLSPEGEHNLDQAWNFLQGWLQEMGGR
ncbi:hypothetical protein GALL_208440 [mine drainage metagenome]|uniref:Hydrogenase maturation protease n=1 Tax=mine drainage metagenome TaxID=410659 RepID=A0A1J5RLR3_9ZZZZ